jgi:hypothetical protein
MRYVFWGNFAGCDQVQGGEEILEVYLQELIEMIAEK